MNNIQIADNQNGVLFDSSKGSSQVIANQAHIEVIKLEDEKIQLRFKNLDIKSKVGFGKGVFPDVVIKNIENKFKMPKVMWNKLLKAGMCEEFNTIVEQLNGTKLWYANDEKAGKDCFDLNVIAYNAAFMIVTAKIKTNGKK